MGFAGGDVMSEAILRPFLDYPVLVAAFCTLGVFTLLYRENVVSRLFEHLMIGLAMGYGVAVTWTNVLKPNWWDRMVGAEGAPVNLWWLLALLPGLLWYFQMSKKRVWLSRLIICCFMGMAAGNTFKGIFNLLLQPEKGQIPDGFRALYTVHEGGVHPENVLCNFTGGAFHLGAEEANNILFLVIVLCVLSYFFFTFSHVRNPVLRSSSRLGRLFLMVCFGAIFGGAVQGRMSLLIDRLGFLFRDWLHWTGS
jgi:hypothetical protein